MKINFTKMISLVLLIVASFFLVSCQNSFLIDATELYKVSFETNCDIKIDSYRTNKIDSIKELTKEDASFVGWYTNSSFTGEEISFPYELSENTTFYAKWNQKYTVIFQTNGGTEIASYKTAEIKESPLTTKNGCIFSGWYLSADFSGESIDFPFTLTESLVLYAKWTNIYTATFITNGGTAITSQKVATISETPNSSKVGYLLVGWYLDENLSTPVSFPYTLDADTKFYAKWTETTDTQYTVEYYQQDESLSSYSLIESESLIGTTNEETSAKAKSYTGFHTKTFNQANISADGSTTVKIYYDRNSYTITFDANGGVGTMESQIFYYGIPQNLNENAFSRNLYSFSGWSTSKTGDVVYEDCSEVENLSIIDNANINLYAQWFYGSTITIDDVENLDFSDLDGEYTLCVTGHFTTSKLTTLIEKLSVSSATICLDLSKMIGITEMTGSSSSAYASLNKCSNLQKLILPNVLTKIGSYAFYSCSFSSIEIPNSVSVIGENAFRSCSNLTSIDIGEGVLSIGNQAFYGCSYLTNVTIPKSVTKISYNAFGNTSNLASVIFEDKTKWTCTYHDSYSSASRTSTVSVENSTTNANNLSDKYLFYNWTKN